MKLIITATGLAHCLYDELFDCASHEEPNADGSWCADLHPVCGPQLGPYALRSAALTAEIAWLHAHWLERESNSEKLDFSITMNYFQIK